MKPTEEKLKELKRFIYCDADIYKHDENPDYNRFSNEDKIEEHINSVFKKDSNKVAKIETISKGVNYPYNDSDPYNYDTYQVTLNSGITFKVQRYYGRPNWSGNVLFCNVLDVLN